jgi:hypothetical protein
MMRACSTLSRIIMNEHGVACKSSTGSHFRVFLILFLFASIRVVARSISITHACTCRLHQIGCFDIAFAGSILRFSCLFSSHTRSAR